jgi:hypothetical protein
LGSTSSSSSSSSEVKFSGFGGGFWPAFWAPFCYLEVIFYYI